MYKRSIKELKKSREIRFCFPFQFQLEQRERCSKGPVGTTTKSTVCHLQKNLKCCSYQFFVFVSLFAPDAPESLHVSRNVNFKGPIIGDVREIRWPDEGWGLRGLSRKNGFCRLTKHCRPPNFFDGMLWSLVSLEMASCWQISFAKETKFCVVLTGPKFNSLRKTMKK